MHVEALAAESPLPARAADAFERLFAAEYTTVVRVAYRVLGDAALA